MALKLGTFYDSSRRLNTMKFCFLLLVLLDVRWSVAAIKEDHMANVGHRCFCGKGFKLVLPCNKTSPATCRRCGRQEYQDERNEGKECKRCTRCPRSSKVTMPCTRTSDAECSCIASEHHFSKLKGYCIKCTDCPPGFEAEHHCSFLSDRTCRKCQAGTFSIGSGSKCRPCKICHEYKLHCNETHDALCVNVLSTIVPPSTRNQRESEKMWLKIVVPSVAVLLVGLLGSFIYCVCCKKKCKRLRSTCRRQIEKQDRPDYEIPLQGDDPVPGPSENVELRPVENDSGMKVGALPYPVLSRLAVKLNGKCRTNWKELAYLIDVDIDIIRCWEQEPLQAAQRVLQEYETHENASVAGLHRMLLKIQREDAAQLLEPFLSRNEST